MQGASDIKKSGLIECNYVFVKTPTIGELERRLVKRKTETRESIERRVKNAEREVAFAEESGMF